MSIQNIFFCDSCILKRSTRIIESKEANSMVLKVKQSWILLQRWKLQPTWISKLFYNLILYSKIQ